jgi:hypothetical protein
MLYEFALTPGLFDRGTAGDRALGLALCHLLDDLCGCGLVADFGEQRWQAEITTRIQALPESPRCRVQSLLKLLKDRNRLVPQPHSAYAREVDWLRVALDAHTLHPFHRVVTEPGSKGVPLSDDARVITLSDDPDFDLRVWPPDSAGSKEISRTERAFRRALEPVLCFARKVSLIDPHMAARQPEGARNWKYLRMLGLCAELLGRHPRAERRSGEIQIHTGLPRPPKGAKLLWLPLKLDEWRREQLPAWKEELETLHAKYGHTFQVFLWADRPDVKAPRLHDRYIVTNQCGLLSTHGLDCYEDSNSTTTLSLLSEEHRARIWKQYQENSGTFVLQDASCRVPSGR